MILTKSNTPFKTELAAKMAAGRRKLKEFEVVEHEDGFAIEVSEASEVKEATKPWDGAGNPWTVDIFKLREKRPGFRNRFIDPVNQKKKEGELWKVSDGKDYGEDSGPLTRRGMILMEMPEEIAKMRDKHINDLTERRTKSAKEIVTEEAKKIEAQTGNKSIGLRETR